MSRLAYNELATLGGVPLSLTTYEESDHDTCPLEKPYTGGGDSSALG